MARYSPMRSVQTTVPSIWEGLSELVDRGRETVDRRRALDEFERQRFVEEEDRAIQLSEGGYERHGDTPTRVVEADEDVFTGSRPGLAAQDPRSTRPSLFEGAAVGMQPAREPGFPSALDGLAREGRPPRRRLAAPAGAYVPGVGFAPRNIFDDELPGMQQQPPRRAPDPRYEHVTGDLYRNLERTPDAVARRAAEEDERGRLARLARGIGVLQDIGRAGLGDETRLAEAIAAGLPPNMVLGPDAGGPAFELNVGGIRTSAATPEEALELRDRFAVPDQPDDVNWQTVTDAETGQMYQLHPRTGQVRPVPIRGARPGSGSGEPDATSLRKEFLADPGVKEASTVIRAYNQIRAVANQQPSGAGDLSLIFSYMKMLDPGSVVREGEFANAENAQGVPARVRSMYNRALNGERLSEGARGDFVNTARTILDAQRQSFAPALQRYTYLAGRAGLDPQLVVDDPFAVILGEGASDEQIDTAAPLPLSPDNPFGGG